jgi:SAM-dependent methyltransferase
MLWTCAQAGPLQHILNAGAGEGLYSPDLLRSAGLTWLVDMDLNYKSFRPVVRDSRQVVLAGSLTAIPVTTGSMDLVFCTEVLEHVGDDGAAFDELRRVLKPDGWLLLSTPTPPAEFDPLHVREGYHHEALVEMLSARGLEVVDVDFCIYAVYRRILPAFRRFGRLPSGLVRLGALIDRRSRWGMPMNIVVLAQLPSHQI